MSRLKICRSATARFVILPGILFSTAFLSSQAMSAPPAKKTSVKRPPAFSHKNLDSLAEEFSFSIQNFKMNHQSEIHNLNIKVRYRYEAGISDSQYPDFRSVAQDIQRFLEKYPDEVGYWEIVNKNLTRMVLKKYPVLSNITVEIQVPRSHSIPYSRSSIVTRRRSQSR